jgi:hypothetical protein
MKRIVFILIAVFTAGLFSVSEAPAVDVESTFHGQFRINSYYQTVSEETGLPDVDETVASRLRFRPTWDVTVDDVVKLHIQLNIGHINSNIFNARYTLSNTDPGAPAVALRHGYISAPIPDLEGWTLTAGIIPLSDKFGDVLFSGDWDYNPLAFMLTGTVANIKVRVVHANAIEGDESSTPGADDVDQWIVDADTDMGLGASYYGVNVNSIVNTTIPGASGITNANEHYLGVRYNGTFSQFDVGGWALYNWGSAKVSGSPDVENTGYALKGEIKTDLGKAKVGVMALYSTGDDGTSSTDSDAFITPASIVGTTGYWGYVGKLNVQGPTDTGIDCQAINIDGADWCNGADSDTFGTGVTTVQAKVAFPLIEGKLDGYASVGWFVANETPAGQDDSIGTDLYAQVKYHFSEHMALEAGVDYVSLGEGHPDNVKAGANESRTMTLAFSRLQLEF